MNTASPTTRACLRTGRTGRKPDLPMAEKTKPLQNFAFFVTTGTLTAVLSAVGSYLLIGVLF